MLFKHFYKLNILLRSYPSSMSRGEKWSLLLICLPVQQIPFENSFVFNQGGIYATQFTILTTILYFLSNDVLC